MATILGTGVIRASIRLKSETVQIPFAFKVKHHQMPAGMYRIMHEFGEGIAVLVNARTGDRVQLLLPAPAGANHKTKLVFEHTGEGYVLKRLS
jgi:hypothetical protein